MAYSDNQWDKAKAGRVYPKQASGRLLKSNPKAAHKSGDAPLVKPDVYKSLNGF